MLGGLGRAQKQGEHASDPGLHLAQPRRVRLGCLPGDVWYQVAQRQQVAVRQAVPARRSKVLLRFHHIRLRASLCTKHLGELPGSHVLLSLALSALDYAYSTTYSVSLTMPAVESSGIGIMVEPVPVVLAKDMEVHALREGVSIVSAQQSPPSSWQGSAGAPGRPGKTPPLRQPPRAAAGCPPRPNRPA